MTIYGKDSLQEASAGVALTAHTPSGSGATGGAWIAGVASSYVAPVSRASNTGFRSPGTSTGNSYLNNSAVAGEAYAQCVISFGDDTGYAGPMLARDALTATGSSYSLLRFPGSWRVQKSLAGVNTTLGTPGAGFSVGTPYTLRLVRAVSGANASLTAIINGVSYGPYTDSSSAFVGNLFGGLGLYDAKHVNTAITNFESGDSATVPTVTHTADNARFDYAGAWIADGTNRKTVCNGSSVNFGFSGDTCDVIFDVSAASIKYPSIAYQVDDAAWVRAVLTPSTHFTITPPRLSSSSPAANYHTVRMVMSIDPGNSPANNNYTTLRDAAVFQGVALPVGKNLTKIAQNANRIEFAGDSLTAGIRVFYTSSDSVSSAAPELNFPEITARMLGCVPVVMGHGGQGITTTATDGFPAATAGWRKAASGVDYSPAVEPVAVVLYYATNDTSGFTQAQYQALLTAVRASCPNALIFAVVPYNQSARASTISAAVTAMADSNIIYLNYTSVIVSADTTDGTHHNAGGAVKIATDLASDILAEFASRGIALQAASGGGSTMTDEWDQLRSIARNNGLELITP